MAILCYYAVFGIKFATTKHEIMLHAMSLKGGSRWWITSPSPFSGLGDEMIDSAVLKLLAYESHQQPQQYRCCLSVATTRKRYRN